ncbi:MAG: hypothetical protein ACREU7_09700 [Burkholderiales bacterium]
MNLISERSLEEAIQAALTAIAARETPGGFDAGGWQRRPPEQYDRALCLIPDDVLAFVYATQPKAWEKLKQHHGAEVKEKFLQRLAREVESRGTLDVLRNGIKDSGCKFDLLYFRPSSGLNPELQKLYAANAFSVVLRDLNERFGTSFKEEDKIVIRQLEESLATNEALAASVRANTVDNARLTFDHVANDRLQELVEINFEFYKRVTDDPAFSRLFVDWMFDRIRKRVSGPN